MDSLLVDPPGAYLRYRDIPGDELPIVWIHALGCASSADFADVVGHPSLAGHRSVLIDLFGHGYSDAPDEFGYSLEDHANSAAQLMGHLSLMGCAVVGHSMGGSVAITLAAVRPDLVTRVVIAEGNLDPGGGPTSAGIAAQTEPDFVANGHGAIVSRFLGDGLVTRAATFRVSSPRGLYRSAVGLVNGTRPTMRERLYTLPPPKAYLFGERNLPDPDWDALSGEGVRVLVVPDSGHDMPIDSPGGLAQAVAVALAVADAD